MNDNIFQKVLQLSSDFEILKSEIISKNKELSETMKAVEERVEDDRETLANKIKALTEQAASSEIETVRNVKMLEIERLKGEKIGITKDETALIEEQIEALEAAIHDGLMVKGQLEEGLREAKAELEKIRENKNKLLNTLDNSGRAQLDFEAMLRRLDNK